jgi:RNA polymerase sigma-70 factor (ECF subfamily)
MSIRHDQNIRSIPRVTSESEMMRRVVTWQCSGLRGLTREIPAAVQGSVDPSDVLQEAYIDVAGKLPAYLKDASGRPLFLWLRLVVGERLVRIHRQHLGTAMRDAGREVSLYRGALPGASSVSLAAHLLGRATSASGALTRAEVQLQLQTALDGMDPMDREIIGLRNFEELSNSEPGASPGQSALRSALRVRRSVVRDGFASRSHCDRPECQVN